MSEFPKIICWEIAARGIRNSCRSWTTGALRLPLWRWDASEPASNSRPSTRWNAPPSAYHRAADKASRSKLVDLDVMASAAHQLVYAAAAMRDHGVGAREFNRAAGRIAKLYATDSAVSAARLLPRCSVATGSWRSIRRHGSIATQRSSRSARALEIQRLLIARRLGLPVE